MNNQDLFAFEIKEVTAGTHGLAALVHEGLGLEQFVLRVICKLCMELLGPLYRWIEVVTEEPTDIVPSFFIYFSRVAEEDEKFYHTPIIG